MAKKKPPYMLEIRVFLAEVAEWPDEIDVNRAQAAKTRAEERLRSHSAEIDVARAEMALRRALVRLDVKQ